MKQFKDAIQLIEHCKLALRDIEHAYDQSLHEKEIKSSLLIGIKNIMENLRSALDYTARGIFEKYGNSSNPTPRIYFPYAWNGLSRADFRSKRIVENCIPGINSSRPDIVAKIESYQQFDSPRNNWLPLFMEINNENKHQQLIPQERREKKKLVLSSNGRTMTLSGKMTLSKGHQMKMGKMIIPGGQTIDTSNPPVFKGEGTAEILTWTSFHFSSNNQPVLPFLKACIEGTESIINDLISV